MERRIDEFRWHCGAHPCVHDEAPDSPVAWRYAVIGRDFAYSLTVCKSSGELSLHRAFAAENEQGRFEACDLLGGHGCIHRSPSTKTIAPPGVELSDGLIFWSQFAQQGQLDQPPKFWRELERRARAAAKAAKAESYHSTRCPRCAGTGTIVVKPRKREPA